MKFSFKFDRPFPGGINYVDIDKHDEMYDS